MRLGGVWTFAAAVAIPLCLLVLDELLGKDCRPVDGSVSRALTWSPRIYIVLQLAVTAWVALTIALTGTSLLEAAGLTLSNGLTTGVFGLVASHEMIHSRDRPERLLGLMLLGSVFYAHFSITHVFGHHRRAATFDDPVTARRNESLYAFLHRSIVGQVRDAWDYEAQRGRGPNNLMVQFLAVEFAFLLAIALASRAALAFVLVNAALAILLLETFNYVAHYGLRRRLLPDGSIEPLGPQHSWNSSNRMNNAALFNMGRHSDHHCHTARHYQQLDPIRAAPELPSGYAAAMLTALVPPLWRQVMDERVTAVRAKYRSFR